MVCTGVDVALMRCAFIVPFAGEIHGFDIADPMAVFALALSVVLIVPLLFDRLKLPGLIGLIAAGIALGPHAANLIPEDSLVQPMGAAGLLYLMFLVGLEIDMHRFSRERRYSIVFGLLTFLIPQVLGTLGAVVLLGFSWPASILLASMFASHTLVPYPIIQRLGLVKERVVTTTAGGTVLTDTLAAVIVGVRIGLFSPDVLNGTILMILATCLLGPWVTEHYGRRLALQAGERELDSSGAPERIMIPVSAADQIEPLMALATMLRPPRSSEALYPTMMVSESGDPDAAVAAAEKVLAAATLQAVEAEAPVQPIVRLSDNMVEEILGSARGLRISTLVMDDRLSYPTEFEHVPTRLIEMGRHMVFRFIHPGPLNTCRRILAAVPPLMERQAGFPAAWTALQRLASQAGVSLHVLADQATLKAMERCELIPSGDSGVKRTLLAHFTGIASAIRKEYQENDLCIVFLARTGQLSWKPAHARLPNLMKRLLAPRPCLALYPPEMKWEKDPAVIAQSPAVQVQSLFPAGQVFLDMGEPTVSEAVRRIVETIFPDPTPPRRRLLENLALMAREAALRIAPGCLLLHTHKASPPAPMVVLATRGEGFVEDAFAGAGVPPPRVLILLLGIPEESPEEHLRRLAAISSMFNAGGWLQKVCQARSYEDLIALLTAAQPQGAATP